MPGSAATVLVCDDDTSVRLLLVRIIERAGHRALPVATGREAIELLATTQVDIVMADQRLSAMTGIDLHGAIVRLRPDLATRFLLITGDPGDPAVVAFAGRWRVPVLAKPFNLGLVPAIVSDLLDR